MGQLKPIRLSVAQRYILRDFLNARRSATMEWASVVHELTMRCGLLGLSDEMETLEEAHNAAGAKRPFDLQTLMDAGGTQEYGVDSDVLASLRKALDEHKWGVATDPQGREVVVGGAGMLELTLVYELGQAVNVAIASQSFREQAEERTR